MPCLDLAVFTKGNAADGLVTALRGESFDGDAVPFCVTCFRAGDATCGEAGWAAGVEGRPAADEEAAAVGAPAAEPAVEAADLVGRAGTLPGGGNAAAGVDTEGRVAAFPGEGRRAVEEAGPDKCLLREGPVARVGSFRKVKPVSAEVLVADE